MGGKGGIHTNDSSGSPWKEKGKKKCMTAANESQVISLKGSSVREGKKSRNKGGGHFKVTENDEGEKSFKEGRPRGKEVTRNIHDSRRALGP